MFTMPYTNSGDWCCPSYPQISAGSPAISGSGQPNAVQCSAVQYSVQCSAVQCSAVQYSVQYFTVQCSGVQCSGVE